MGRGCPGVGEGRPAAAPACGHAGTGERGDGKGGDGDPCAPCPYPAPATGDGVSRCALALCPPHCDGDVSHGRGDPPAEGALPGEALYPPWAVGHFRARASRARRRLRNHTGWPAGPQAPGQGCLSCVKQRESYIYEAREPSTPPKALITESAPRSRSGHWDCKFVSFIPLQVCKFDCIHIHNL